MSKWKDTPATQSIRQRLLNISQTTGQDYNHILTRFAIERILYRIGMSDVADQFVLKGAMLFTAWMETAYRPTRDLDLLGHGEPTEERIASIFHKLCSIDVEEDGLIFDAESIHCKPIQLEQQYDGLNITILSYLGTARITLNIDIGFGDIVTPAPQKLSFPTLLELPSPIIQTYTPETVIAEKVEAIVSLGITNSRMKDYYDIWRLLQNNETDYQILRDAIHATFARRHTTMPQHLPIGLSREFYDDPAKQKQWDAFLARSGLSETIPLANIIKKIRSALIPLIGIQSEE